MQQERERRLAVAVIHNQSADRLSHIRPHCADLCRQLDAEYFEVFEQPEIVLHSRATAAFRYAVNWAVGRLWARHRLLKPRPLALHFPAMLAKLAWKYFLSRDRRPLRISAIEEILADKHVEAWRRFRDTSADFLLVFEDDAVFLPDSIQRLRGALDQVADAGKCQYVDVTGPNSFSGIGIAHLIQSQEHGLARFSRPVTNSAGGYLISRPTAEVFLSILREGPWFASLQADWLINALFMEAMNDGIEFHCWHAFPPMFRHGSATGDYSSSIMGQDFLGSPVV